MGHKTIRIAAAAIVDARGRLLLVRKRGTSTFMQPGGKIEPGEKPEAALLRELNEELGLSFEMDALRYLGVFSAEAANEPDAMVVADLYEVNAIGKPTPAAEIEEIAWLDTQNAGGIALAPLTRDLVLPRYS
ncbi:MAG TPA: NUDIX domain-containing protein [Mesorhizobium sp.]|jgi:8-oxo-dGTP pyrophosphatase MutT (NUDIX family)|uniref:NUDIX hydrolase n=1 Tax=Mesorhizobium sp. TaxID=1871066 RepID=UPI002DDC93AB|nr:NUDIX domain-containing protein [Mesorhizobium sp.]HEV2503619.1 NUDIX domain-containing protein [Mesorhizobium sp.]